ncbi:MAG: zinc-ribbon domain-containing protein [Candidatus Hodarchaeales archaeon]
MSQTTYCTNCGKEISITARFCRFCGAPTRKSQSSPSTTIITPTRTTNNIPPPSPVSPPARELFEKIPDEIVDILFSRKRKMQIKDELKRLLDEINELDKKVDIGLIDENEKNVKFETIQSTMVALQEEQKSLHIQPLKLEKLIEEEKLWKKRLERLEEKNRAGAVSREVYASLRDEYSAELASVQQNIGIEERKARRWLVDLQRDTRALESEIERVRVKAEIEGKSPDQIKVDLEEMNKNFTKKSIAADILSEILGSIYDKD